MSKFKKGMSIVFNENVWKGPFTRPTNMKGMSGIIRNGPHTNSQNKIYWNVIINGLVEAAPMGWDSYPIFEDMMVPIHE